MNYNLIFSFTVAAAGGFLLAAAGLKARQSGTFQLEKSPALQTSGILEIPAVLPAPIGNKEDLAKLIIDDDRNATNAAIWEALKGMSPAAVGELARNLAVMARGDYALESAAQVVWERWTQVDLEGSIAFFPRITNDQIKIYAGYSLINRLALKDTARMEKIIATVDKTHQNNAKEILLYRIAEKDPPEAAHKFGEPFYKGLSSADNIAKEWARLDAGAALEWVQSLTMDQGREAALKTVLQVQVKKDPAAAAGMLHAAPGDQQPALRSALAEGWCQADDPAALGWVRSLTDPAERRQAWEGYLRAKTRLDSAAAAAVLKTLPEDERETLRYRVLETLNNANSSRIYGEGALSAPADLLEGARRGAMLDPEQVLKIISSIYPKDDKRVLDWALHLGSDESAVAAANVSFTRMENKDIAAAAQQIDALENPDRRAVLQEKLSAHWASSDLPAATAWMRTLPPEEQPEVLGALILGAKPAEAAPLLAEALQADPVAADDPAWLKQVNTVYNSWAYADGPSAAASAVNLPPGENRLAALRQVQRRWHDRNAAASAEWIQTLHPEDQAALNASP